MAIRRSRRPITRCLYKDTIEVFIEELNASGGIGGRPIKFVFEDDENNPVTAASRVEKLAAQGALLHCLDWLVGHRHRGPAKADEMKIPHGSPTNTAVRLSQPLRHYYFRLSITDDLISEAMLRFIKRNSVSRAWHVIRDATETVISDFRYADQGAEGCRRKRGCRRADHAGLG